MDQCKVENKLAWNMPFNGDCVIWPVNGEFSWSALLEFLSNESDPLKSMTDESKSSSSSPLINQNTLATNLQEQINTSLSANDIVAQPLGQCSSGFTECPLPYPFQNHEIASPSHSGTQNQYKPKSYKIPNGNHHHPHQSYGSRCNYEHENQNFNGRGGFSQAPRSIPGFVRYAPPPPPPPPLVSPIFAPYMLPAQWPFYHFSGPMAFHNSAPPLRHYRSPPRVTFIQPHEVVNQVQEVSLETRIRNQVHYYFSETNLRTDEFMRRRMNDEGFVHIQFIAGFRKLKALTCNIQLILDALQGSYHVELKGYEIRSRHKWREYLMPLHLRVPFVPSLEDEMASNVQNVSLEQKIYEIGSSSSNQRGND